MKRPGLVLVVLTISLSLFTGNIFSQEEEKKRPKRGSIALGVGPEVNVDKNFTSQLNAVTTEIATTVAQSVVSVRTFKYFNPRQNVHPFYEFFFGNPPPQQQPPQPEPKEKGRPQPFGGGSGIISSEDGYILTNAHVIDDADKIEVTLINKKVFDAEVVGMDKPTDIAVLKINPDGEKLRPVVFGSSYNLNVGEWVLAIGNPFAYNHTVTAGIVSQKGRRGANWSGSNNTYQDFIQTDAAVNPGNSGGPLVNLAGQVVGINSLIFSRSGGYQGISFAIPIEMSVKVAKDLIYEGKVTRGFLGVQIKNVDPDVADALGMAYPRGTQVVQVIEDTPAEKGGVKASDIILRVEEVEIEDADHLRNTVAALSPGEKYEFEILRGGKKFEKKIKIGSLDSDSHAAISPDEKKPFSMMGKDQIYAKALGFKASVIDDDAREKFGIEKSRDGLVVTSVTRASSADVKGLQPGDILIEFKRRSDKKFQEITDITKFFSQLTRLSTGENIAFKVLREDRTLLLALKAED